MAKAKKTKKTKAARGNGKMNGKANGKSMTLPDGYKVIGRAPNWDVDKHPVIQGERGPTNEVVFDRKVRGQKKPVKDVRRCCVVNDESIGPVNVWESGMLKLFFDQTDDGDAVRIEFLGYGTAKRGQNAPKLFQCMVKE